ncbi:MAG TPA: pentapeptide repeat-containing protein [Dongiaceae bacterium]|jgi:uncharacterized protein YjbI with pentapeptide repeats|nr:pentapeptide repeat-containing protein [Dongiaceae bacterium]
MADTDQVALLRQGAAAWNAWRSGHADQTPDLSGASLRGLDLSDADLSGADLRKADLRGTNLRKTRLNGARLEEANLFKAVLEDADLDGAVLLGAQFLNCAQLVTARNWASSVRDPSLACGAPIPTCEG